MLPEGVRHPTGTGLNPVALLLAWPTAAPQEFKAIGWEEEE